MNFIYNLVWYRTDFFHPYIYKSLCWLLKVWNFGGFNRWMHKIKYSLSVYKVPCKLLKRNLHACIHHDPRICNCFFFAHACMYFILGKNTFFAFFLSLYFGHFSISFSSFTTFILVFIFLNLLSFWSMISCHKQKKMPKWLLMIKFLIWDIFCKWDDSRN